jgi:hypothetical protein
MKNNESKSYALSNLNANSQNEINESQVLNNTSVNDVTTNALTEGDMSQVFNVDEDPWKWGNLWDWYAQKIIEKLDYLKSNEIPKIEFIIGLIVHQFVEILEEDPKAKYINIKDLAFDHSSRLESRRPKVYYSIEETSEKTGIPTRLISNGINQGYFLCETINGMWLFTEAHIQFIRSFAHFFIDLENDF